MSGPAVLNISAKPDDTSPNIDTTDVSAIVAEEIARAKSKHEAEQNKSAEKDSDAEAEIEKKVSMGQLFRFADKLDVLLMLIASICSALNGAAQPVMSIIFSNTIGVFTNYIVGQFFGATDAVDVFDREIKRYVLYFVLLAAASFIVAYFQLSFWMIAGERQCVRIRERYYRAILRQEIGWFDVQKSGELTSRLSGDVNVIQDGVSEKVGLIIQAVFMLVTGFVIAFIRGWRLALVLLAVIPLIMISGAFMGKSISSKSKFGQDAYARAGHLAEEVLSSIKTVVSFGSEQREIERYDKELDEAYNEGKRRALVTGFGIGVMIFIMFSSYALAFWYGGKLVLDGHMTGEEVLNVVFALIIGAMGIGQAAPHFAAVSTAQGAAAKIYHVIDRDSEIDSLAEDGKMLQNFSGTIEFRNVDFRYPTRPDVQILKNFSLKVLPGQTVALVGSSGSGKSTCVQLLERFYDPEGGQILLDGADIKELNVGNLRKHIGLVGQEPVLFGVSIFQNIVWGAQDDQVITMGHVIEACKKANAHEFIQDLPEGYDTLVGEKGALLSGGQKQRIAIARALINNPQIMLLDEATSALDTESEKLVQNALDKAAMDRTTIVIAHRLSTIKDADMIVVMDKGEIKETGKHDELVARGGLYARLVTAQTLKSAFSDGEQESSSDDDLMLNRALDKSKSLTKTKTKESVKSKVESLNKKEGSLQFMRIVRLNLPDKYLMLIGGMGSIAEGAILPVFSVVFSEILFVFSQVGEPDTMRSGINFWSLMFFVLAIVSFLTAFTRIALFGIAGERLIKLLRSMSYRSMIKQEVGFFDLPENGTGILCAKLATEAESMKGLSSQVIGSILQGSSALITGLVIAFINGWKLTLVVLACVPLIGFAGMAQIKALSGYSEKTKKVYEEAAQIACESVENMRTVASLSREETFFQLYRNNLVGPNRLAIRGALLSSVGYGCSQALVFLVYSVAFYYGSRLIISGEYQLDRMFRVLFSVVFSAVAVSQVISFTPNVAKARAASISLFELIDRPSRIDAFSDEGKNMETNGRVTAQKVRFSYPARPDVTVLKGFQAEVPAGKTVAIVGSSGSGKSTLVSLVQRFYDVKDGKVLVEDTDVREWNIKGLRSQMAMVGQEPVLFDMSIGENIAYGLDGASQEMIEQAAKQANIHDFIINLPDQYNTGVGEKGAQLSGGQKQRVAIARAIIRNPRLLLLDEATSALDSESEKVVQNALDKAAMNRTTITIAHRLSTIQNADMILVVKHGVVVEQGKHQDLIRQKGFYYSLVQKQSLSTS